mgnify:CR=1 FL=1
MIRDSVHCAFFLFFKYEFQEIIMKTLTMKEMQTVSGGGFGSFVGGTLIGALVTDIFYNPVKQAVIGHYTGTNAGMASDFKKSPLTLESRFSFNGDF